MRAKKHKKPAPEPPPPPPKLEPLGPTDHAKTHGDYVLPETRGALAVFTNRKVNVLMRLRQNGSITERQCAGGLCLSATYEAVWGSGSARDPLDFGPRGQAHETEAAAERMASMRARLNTVANRVGPACYSMLVSVCVFAERMGEDKGRNVVRYSALRNGLEQCAVVYGVSEA